MKKLSVMLFLIISLCYASDADNDTNEVDCLVIKEENSIICKYMTYRPMEDRTVTFKWINPKGDISRTREILFPSGHGSVYDFRYLSGRETGIWNLKVKDGNNEYSTEFEVK